MRMHVEKSRGDIGEALFLYWMTWLGWVASRPLGDKQCYDFVVNIGKKLLRVQVRTTLLRAAKNSYPVCAGRSEGMQYKPFRKGEIDFW